MILLGVYTFGARGSVPPDRSALPTLSATQIAAQSAAARVQEVAGGGPSHDPDVAIATTPLPAAVTPRATPGASQSTPVPGAAATPAPTATPVPAPIAFEGSGSQVHSFSHPGGAIRATSKATSPTLAGCVYIGTIRAVAPTVLAYDRSLTTSVIWVEGAGSGTGWVDLTLAPGSYEMVVDSDCDWRVIVASR